MRHLLTAFVLLCLLATTGVAQGKFDINRATAAEIAAALEGVGAKKAAAIVAHRNKHGALRSTDDLLQVPGLGPKIISKNLLTLGLKRGKLPLDGKRAGTAKKSADVTKEKKAAARDTADAAKAKAKSKSKTGAKPASKPARAKKPSKPKIDGKTARQPVKKQGAKKPKKPAAKKKATKKKTAKKN